MRVIAGKYRSRLLKTSKGCRTRPTSDMNKERLFNIIGPFFEGGNCLDLFGGSGGLAIEAISRGMNQAMIVDKDHQSLLAIKQNIASLKLENQITVYRSDAFELIMQLNQAKQMFNLIFIDPPYHKELAKKALVLIDQADIVKPGGWVVVETTAEEASPSLNCLVLTKEKAYGSTIFRIYTKKDY